MPSDEETFSARTSLVLAPPIKSPSGIYIVAEASDRLWRTDLDCFAGPGSLGALEQQSEHLDHGASSSWRLELAPALIKSWMPRALVSGLPAVASLRPHQAAPPGAAGARSPSEGSEKVVV